MISLRELQITFTTQGYGIFSSPFVILFLRLGAPMAT
jgi:hypothetical protein